MPTWFEDSPGDEKELLRMMQELARGKGDKEVLPSGPPEMGGGNKSRRKRAKSQKMNLSRLDSLLFI